MSRKVYVLGVQPDPNGPLFGRNQDPTDFQKAQAYAHAHVESVTKDLLLAGSVGPVVAGFNLALTSALGLSIAAGRAIDLDGFLFDLDGPIAAQLEAADVTNPRYDLVYASLQKDVPAASEARDFIRLRTENELATGVPPYAPTQFNDATELHNQAVIAVRKGTPAGSPSVPAAGANEVALFKIHVAAGQTALASGDVTDLRRTMRSLAQALILIDALTGQVGDLGEVIDDRVAGLLVAGTGIQLAYDDVANALTVGGRMASAGGPGLMSAAQYGHLGLGASAPQLGLFLQGQDGGASTWLSLTLEQLVDSLGYTPVNKAGDTMSGELLLPTDGLDIGNGQLRAIGGSIIMAGILSAARMNLKGGSGEESYQIHLGDGDGQHQHRVLTSHGPTAPENGMTIYLWGPDAGSGSNPGFDPAIIFSNQTGAGPQTTLGGRLIVPALASLQSLAVTGGGTHTIQGNLTVAGALTKGSGTFLIDHPLDPENKNLVHGFIEGPRYDLIYRGRTKLENGRAVVSIDEASGMTPGTFAALTRDAQGFAWNESSDEDNFDQVRVIKIEGDLVHIKSNNPSVSFEVGWQVIAERNDAYIQHADETENGRLRVEVDKLATDADEVESLLADRIESVPTSDPELVGTIADTREEVATELAGKKGYPIHPEAIGLQPPKRKVVKRFVAAPAADVE